MVYGIDLGTTYSCITKFDGTNNPEVIPIENGRTTLPSVVQFKFDGRIVVGSIAKRQAALKASADQVLSLFKRQMGVEYCAQSIQTSHGPRRVSPIEGSACILRKLISPIIEMNRATGNTERPRAVISIPTGFTGWQRAATKLAAELAGFDVLGLIHEPTAAALSFNINAGERILVFDLGGGTLDVSIVHHYEAGKYRVVASASDFEVLGHYLGGQDWDKLIAAEIAGQNNIDINLDNTPEEQRYLRAQLMNKAEEGKMALTEEESYTDILTGYTTEFTLSRADFERISQHLTLQCIKVVDEAIHRSGLSDVELKEMRLITVGGSSFMPMIRNILTRNYGGRIGTGAPNEWFPIGDPGQAIAKGAAIYAYLLDTNRASIYELSSHSYGTSVYDFNKKDGEFGIQNLIKRSDPMIFNSKVYQFVPCKNGQSMVTVDVWENESDEDILSFSEAEQLRNSHRRIFYEGYSFANPNNVTTATEVFFTVSRDRSGIMTLEVKSDGSPAQIYHITPLQDEECQRIRERLNNIQ